MEGEAKPEVGNLVTVQQAASRLGCSAAAVYDRIERKTIRKFKRKGRIMVPEADLVSRVSLGGRPKKAASDA